MMTSFYKRIFADIYILLWCVFNVTFAVGNSISRPIYVVLFAISIIYSCKSLSLGRMPVYIKGLWLLLIMFVVYGTISIVNRDVFYIRFVNKEVDSTIYLISITKSLLPILTFYYFVVKGYITLKIVKRWIPLLLITCIAQYYFLMDVFLQKGYSAGGIVNNSGYVFIGIIPLLYFLKRQRDKWICLGIVIVFLLISLKRGAIIIGIIGAIIFILSQLRTASRKNRTKIIVSSLFFVCIAAIGITYLYEQNPMLQRRMELMLEGNSSHRDVILEDLTNYWMHKETFAEQLVGMGASATLKIGDNYAHNDWLEILINNGCIGIIVFIIYWVSFFKQYKYFIVHSPLRYAMFTLAIISLLKTFISMYYTAVSTPMALCLGYCIGQYKLSQLNEKRLSHFKNSSLWSR